MRVSYRWLMSLLGREIPLAEVVERLTMSGIEVEGVVDLGAGSGRIVTGKILEIAPHPNAENLVLCQVDTGQTEPLRIVCGAKNMKAGDHVPVALEGASLPIGITIKKSKIRGEASQGMMCSADELGINEDHSGLLLLPKDSALYRIGEPFDAILDLKITPNRPDCLSAYGLARDLAAVLGAPAPEFPSCRVDERGEPASASASVRVDAPADCPRYAGRVIRNVKIGPSPLWLQRIIEAAGLRPISNVVDVTNYVMLELGQPLHAFDLDKVPGGEVIIRLARDGEEVTTLDGQKNTMAASDLLIADREKPIALAGIMGCGNSEIDENTRNVFLECAYFRPASVRNTSKRLKKSTDASYRFERGADWENVPRFVDRAAQLIADVSGGEVAPGRLDAKSPDLAAHPQVHVAVSRINEYLGTSLDVATCAGMLSALGFDVETAGDTLIVGVPAYRPDVSVPADIVEEIARLYGYERIPCELPRIASRATAIAPEDRLADLVRCVCTRFGFLEAMNYSFLSADAIAKAGFNPEDSVRLENPISAEYSLLRTSLLPGLLQSLLYNQNHGTPDCRLFEVGQVFRKSDGDEEARTAGAESWEFCALISGAGSESTWKHPAGKPDLFEAKEIAEEFLAQLGIESPATKSIAPNSPYASVGASLHPGKSAELLVGDRALLAIGELHPKIQAALEIKRKVQVIVARFEPLVPCLDTRTPYAEIPTFPTVQRDLALVADVGVSAADIEATIQKRAKSLLRSISLFDVYEGEKIAAGKRSLAYTLQFGVPDRTLKDEEVNQLQERVLADLKAKLGVELRS